jgi:quinol monooxygenase YgiN
VPRVLFHAVHHPHPEHLDDLLAAMRRLTAAAQGLDGLEEIGAFLDRDGMRVVAISVWSSAEALQAGSGTLFAGLGDVPFDEWERRPRELLTLPEVARD